MNNLSSSLSRTKTKPASTAGRILLATLTGALAFVAGGCSCPVQGPTDPLAFIVQGRRWTSPASTPTPSVAFAPTNGAQTAPAAPLTGDTLAVPPANGR